MRNDEREDLEAMAEVGCQIVKYQTSAKHKTRLIKT